MRPKAEWAIDSWAMRVRGIIVLVHQCIFETESQDIRIVSFFGHPWKFPKAHFSIMSPKFQCQARNPSEKYRRKILLTGKRIFHEGYHITKCFEQD